MRALAALLALAACQSPESAITSAEPVTTGNGTPHFDGLPPERFWREDVAIVVFVNDVTELCGTAPEGLTIIACARKIEGQAVLVMPHPVGRALAGEHYARILTHELGHHAGWAGDHPE